VSRWPGPDPGLRLVRKGSCFRGCAEAPAPISQRKAASSPSRASLSARFLHFRGLGGARLGPVWVREPPWFRGKFRESHVRRQGPRNCRFAGIFMRIRRGTFCLPCRRSRVRIPSAAFRKGERAAFAGLFRCSSRVVRPRTMTGQSWRRRLADAVGRCSLAGDSERPAPWNFCVLADDRESTAPGRCPCPPAPLRRVRGRSAAFVEEHTLNLSFCSSSDARGHSRRDRRECNSHGGNDTLDRGRSRKPPVRIHARATPIVRRTARTSVSLKHGSRSVGADRAVAWIA